MLRVFSEARTPCPPEHTASLSWRPSDLPPADWQSAALSLWRWSSFQELLKEKEFYVGPHVLRYVTCPGYIYVRMRACVLGLGEWKKPVSLGVCVRGFCVS